MNLSVNWLICWPVELEQNPGWCVRVRSRKGHLQFFMKEYDKALATYQAGLEHDPANAELKEGIARCFEAINKVRCPEWQYLLCYRLLPISCCIYPCLIVCTLYERCHFGSL